MHQTNVQTCTHRCYGPAYSVSPGSMVPYAWGDDNSSECPANYIRITTEEGCRAAAFAKRKYFNGVSNNSARPAGCFAQVEWSSITVFLNTAPVGAGFPDRLPLCAGAPLAHLASIMPCPCVRSSSATQKGELERTLRYSGLCTDRRHEHAICAR
jgi:hypothetical protein